MEEELIPMIGKKVSFNDFMRKIKISQEKILKNSKRIKVGRKGDTRIAAERMGRWKSYRKYKEERKAK